MVDGGTIGSDTYTGPVGSSIFSTRSSPFPPTCGLRGAALGSGVKKPVPVATGPAAFRVESGALEVSGSLRGGNISSISSGAVPRNHVQNALLTE